jgi:hypothetical protein
MWWKDMKMRLLIALGIIVLLLIIIIPIVGQSLPFSSLNSKHPSSSLLTLLHSLIVCLAFFDFSQKQIG